MKKNNNEFEKQDRSFFIEKSKFSGVLNMAKNHYHNAYEIYYLVEGERDYFIKDKTYHVTKGDLVLVDTFELHKTLDSGAPVFERILISFKRVFLRNILAEMQDIDLLSFFLQKIKVLSLNPDEQSFVHALLEKMLSESNTNSAESIIYLKLMLTELLIFISRKVKEKVREQAEPSNSKHGKASEIVAFINDNYQQNISLRSLSLTFHISSCYLSRMFKVVTGFSLIEYLNNVRTKEACKLLVNSRLNITQISEKIGYESITHFGRIFKSITGLSPLKYRKYNQK